MGQYDDERAKLKGFVVPALKAEAIAKGHPSSAELDDMIDSRLEERLANFERVATSHHHRTIFWSGVWQSFVGSLLFLLALTLFALLIWGFKQNPFKVLSSEETPPSKGGTPPPESASP